MRNEFVLMPFRRSHATSKYPDSHQCYVRQARVSANANAFCLFFLRVANWSMVIRVLRSVRFTLHTLPRRRNERIFNFFWRSIAHWIRLDEPIDGTLVFATFHFRRVNDTHTGKVNKKQRHTHTAFACGDNTRSRPNTTKQ